jgi:hypothetical protein
MEVNQTVIDNLESKKYNDLLKIGKELRISTQFKKKPILIEDIKKVWEIKKQEPIISPVIAGETKIEKNNLNSVIKKEVIKKVYKEPLGSLKEYKDGTYQMTENGWKKIQPKIVISLTQEESAI